MIERPTISIVLPTYNEENAVGVVVGDIKKYASDFVHEIIVVDSSTDRTPEIARALGARVLQKPPAGHGDALRTGLAAARGEIIITADCDNTYPMEYIPILIDTLQRERCDLISCNRLTRHLGDAMPFANKLANRAFAFLVRTLYGIHVTDVTTGMFCLTQRLNQSIKLETYVTVPIELIIKAHQAGFHHLEIDIPYRTRIGKVTLQRWRCGKAVIKCIFNYRFNLNIDPRHL
ncbi:MAG: glycosyltransferase family 2 protein [Desulfobacterota bacterium]|nr:glycosyltransferase family 2 protein [Thermodesulfobacteriota bacterium]